MGFDAKIFKKMFENSPDQKRMRSVEFVANRLREKYKYDDLDSFVTYLESMEKFFIEASPRHQNGAELKEDMIKTEMYIMSEALGIQASVLEGIYSQFTSLSASLQDVQEIVQKMLAMYPEEGPRAFIEYLRDITTIFLGYHEEKVFSSEELRAIVDQATEAKMRILSAGGTPSAEILSQIKKEFFEELSKA